MKSFWVLIASCEPNESNAFEVMLHLEGFRTSHQPTLPGVMLDLAAKPSPDLLVLDGKLDERGVQHALDAVRGRRPNLPTIVIAHREEFDAVGGALTAADAVLVRPVTAEQLLGTVVVLLARLITGRRDAVERLTTREAEIAELLAAGGTSRSIADELGVSPRTVEFHRASLHKKLGARNAAEAVSIFQSLKRTALSTPER